MRGLLWPAGLLVLFAALAVGAMWPAWSDPRHVFIGHVYDPSLSISFLGLTQRAVATHSNPFFSTYLNAPDGVNLAWETASPLVAIVVWPFDALFGPISGYNVAMLAGLTLNGWVAALVLRRLFKRWVGATAGALLYAYSPFVTAHARAHLELTILVIPPLLLLVINRVFRTHRERWLLNGLLLAALVIAQYYISQELLFIEGIGVAVGLAWLAVTHRREVRANLVRPLQSAMIATLTSGVFLALPLYVFLHYPQRPVGAIQGYDVYVADVLNFFIPTPNQALSPFSTLSSSFIGSNDYERTAYVGIPLIVLLIAITVWRRRDRLVVASSLTIISLAVLSLGSHPNVGGNELTAIPLPWLPFAHLPVLKDLLTVRIWSVIYLGIAVIVTIGVNAGVRSHAAARAAVGVLVVLAVITFVPQLPMVTSSPPVPAFFTGDVSRIPSGSTVLVAPIPYDALPEAELWQAWSGTRFRLVGGYVHGPDYLHTPSLPFLGNAILTIERSSLTPEPTAADVATMRAELTRSSIRTVILGPAVKRHDSYRELLTVVCGGAPQSDEGVLVWWTCG